MATKAEPKYEKFVDADGVPYPTDKKFYRAADESIFTEENQKYQVWQNKANAEKAFPGEEIKEFVGNEIEHPIVMDKKNKEEFASGGKVKKEVKMEKKLAKGGVAAPTTTDELVEVIDILNAWDKYANLHSEDADDIDEFNSWLNKEHAKLGSKEKQKAVKEFALLHPQSEEYATGGKVHVAVQYPLYPLGEDKIASAIKYGEELATALGTKLKSISGLHEDMSGNYFFKNNTVGNLHPSTSGKGVMFAYYFDKSDNNKYKIYRSEDVLPKAIIDIISNIKSVNIWHEEYAEGGELISAYSLQNELKEKGYSWEDDDEFEEIVKQLGYELDSATQKYKKLYATGGDIEGMDYYAVKSGSGNNEDSDVVFVKQSQHQTRPDNTLKVLSKEEYENGLKGFGKLYSSEYAEGGAVATEFNWKEFNLNQLKEYLATLNDISIAFLLKNAQSGGAQDKWAPDSKQFIEISEGLFNVPNQSKVQFSEGEDGCLYVEIGVYPKEFGFNDLYLHRITLSSKDNQNGLRELAGDLIQFEDNGNLPELAAGGKVAEQKIGGRGFSNYVKGRKLVPADIAVLPKGTIVLGETTQFGGIAQNAFKVSKTAEELSKHHPDKDILYLQYIVSPDLNRDMALWNHDVTSPRQEWWLGVKKKAKKHEAGGSVAEERILKFIAKDNDAADIFAHDCKDNNYSAIQDGLEFSIIIPEGKTSEEFKNEVLYNTIMHVAKVGTWILPEESWHGMLPDLEASLMEHGFIARRFPSSDIWDVLYRISDDEFALAEIEVGELDSRIVNVDKDLSVVEKISGILDGLGYSAIFDGKNKHVMDLDEVKGRYLTVPQEETEEKEELENGGQPKKAFWVKDALVHKGTLRKKAKEMGLIKDDEPLTLNDVAKIEKLGGVWIKKCQLARRLMGMHKKAEGGIVDPKLLAFDDLTTAEKEEVNRRKLVVGEPCKIVNKDGERVIFGKALLKGFYRYRHAKDLYGVVKSNGPEFTIKIKFLVSEDRPDPEVSDLSFLTEKQSAVVNEMLKKLEDTSDDELETIFKNAFDITERQAKFIVSQRFNPATEAEPTDFNFLTDEQLEIANCILGNDNLSSSDDELAKTFKYGFDITDKQAKYLVSFRKEFFLHPGENYKLKK